MVDWTAALTGAGACAGAAVLLRELVIDVISIWSLRANDADRKHARELIKILKPAWRHSRGADAEADPKDPPALTPP